ncbi:MAG TPA: hypothetical protein VF779_16705 [Pyrinomonadaceae bacterium]
MTCLLLFSLLYVFAGQAVHAGVPVNFKFIRNYLVVIPVCVNGAGPYDFLLDSLTLGTKSIKRLEVISDDLTGHHPSRENL